MLFSKLKTFVRLYSPWPNTGRKRASFPWVVPSRPALFAERPLISVVLPVYNGYPFVREAIESVLAASKHNLELVIVNDGSTDKTGEILAKYSSFPRISVINQENAGLSRALNRGFEAVTGSFITWTSADNCYLPGALDRLADYLLVNPGIGFVYGNVQLINEDGKPLRDSSYRTQDQDPNDNSVLLLPIQSDTLALLNDNFVNAYFLYRRELAQLVGSYNPEYRDFEDYDYWLRFSLVAPLGHVDDERALYQYRLHPNSLTASVKTTELANAQCTSVSRARKLRRVLESSSDFTLQTAIGAEHSELAELIAAGLRSRRNRVQIQGDSAILSGCFLRYSSNELPETVTDNNEIKPLTIRFFESQKGVSGESIAQPLKQFLPAYSLPVAAVSVSSSDGKSSSGVCAAGHGTLLPPLFVPGVLKRARDCSYGSVTRAAGSRATLLVITPAKKSVEVSKLSEFIARFPCFTFVLCCLDQEQRASADAINLRLSDNANLRIVDISSEPTPARQLEGLMYLLSSIDLVLSFCPEVLELAPFLELDIECALAAAAGRSVLALTIPDLVHGGARPQQPRYSDLFSPPPHLLFSSTKLDRNKLYSLIICGLSKKLQPDAGTLDQWLESRSLQSFGLRIVALTFRRH